MTRNLVLFGMMGAGKSTVATVVAERLGREVVDTDREVERLSGRRVAEIFAADGEAGFRRRERLAVEQVARRADRVVSVGGGAVLDDRNVECLRSSGVLVELRAPVHVLVARLEGDSANSGEADVARPLLDGADLADRVAELAALRGERYDAVADHVVDADASPVDVADAVLVWAVTAPGVLSDAELGRVMW